MFGKSKDAKSMKQALEPAVAAAKDASWDFDRPSAATPALQDSAPLQEAAPAAETGMPLFYKHPQPLSAIAHAKFKLQPSDAAFAAETNSVPIVATEFAEAARFYPIVFASADASPVALLGLEHANVFIENGQWVERAYVPAYVRRYPFVFIAADQDKFALGIDLGSGSIGADGEGLPLFDGDGQPALLTQQALAFCHAFQMDHQATRDFSAALKEKDLLVDRRADVVLPGGRALGLQGFEVVDPVRLAALDEATVLDWHRKGWLALVHFHLASLSCFRDLLSRQGAREAART